MRYFLAKTAVSVFGVALAHAQISGSAGGSGLTGYHGTMEFSNPPGFALVAVAGAPYSGEQTGESTQTLADGTHITRKNSTAKAFRDSAGRTRLERPAFPVPPTNSSQVDMPIIVEITDPVTQVKYVLDSDKKIAHRQQFHSRPLAAVPNQAEASTVILKPAPGTYSGTSRTNSQAQQSSDEKLGTDTIEGLLVQGHRHTTTFPEGSQGNDRPISTVVEWWTSPELKVPILTKTTDPRSGEHTQRLTNISRAEPSPDLFQPPPDYTVVDESGSFSIKWGNQPQ